MRRIPDILTSLSCLRTLAALMLGTGLALSPAGARAYETTAPIAFMVADDGSESVLYAKNADQRIPPASMSKMMTVYVAFDMLKKGLISPDTAVTVRPATWQKWHNNGGSTMFLSAGEEVSVDQLLHGIVTLSGNDACVVLAEGVAGTEDAYVAEMNRYARRMGLKGSHFANTTGWPDPQEFVTARDLAIIALRTIHDFPDLYRRYYGLGSYTHGTTMGGGKPIVQENRNPLLGKVAGADGLKTGHTEEAGYGLTGSAARDGLRLITVLSGMTSKAERAEQSVAFMEWGLNSFRARKLLKAGEVAGTIPVWLGDAETVDVAPDRDVTVTMTRMAAADMKVKLAYVGPPAAPIAKGAHIADLVVEAQGRTVARIPLKATRAVDKAGLFGRLAAAWRKTIGAEPQPAAR